MGIRQEELDVCVQLQLNGLIAVAGMHWVNSHSWISVMHMCTGLLRKAARCVKRWSFLLYKRAAGSCGTAPWDIRHKWMLLWAGFCYRTYAQEKEAGEVCHRHLEEASLLQALFMCDSNHLISAGASTPQGTPGAFWTTLTATQWDCGTWEGRSSAAPHISKENEVRSVEVGSSLAAVTMRWCASVCMTTWWEE